MVRVHSGLPNSPRDFSMPTFVYILQSDSSGAFYVGSTSDLPRRLGEHQRSQSPYTRGRGPWKLVHEEVFATTAEARRRERQIKSWKSHRTIQEVMDRQPRG